MKLIPFAVLLLNSAMFHALPLWQRESHYFGVTVAPDYPDSAAGRAALAQYRAIVWTLTVLAAVLLWLAPQPPWIGAALLGPAIGAMVAFAMAGKRTAASAEHPRDIRTASLAPGDEGLPGGWLAHMAPFGILAGAAVWLRLNWDTLPERIVTHWGPNGPDRWADKSASSVYGALAMGGSVLVVLLIMQLAMLHTSRRTGRETTDWTRRYRRLNLKLMTTMMYAMAAVFGVIALAPLQPEGAGRFPAWIGLATLIPVIAFLIPMVRLSREPGSGTDATPDECWYGGMFYYNPGDPALMVEKRFGLGYTLNFGNRMSWVVLAVTIVLPLGVARLVL